MTRSAAAIARVACVAAALVGGMPAAAAPGVQLASVVRFVDLPEAQDGYVGALPEIYVEGPIAEDTLAALRRIVDERRLSSARVLFDSEGGDLLAAVDLGYFLRERGFVTDIGAFGGAWGRPRAGDCHSACALAFLGGKYRFMDVNSRLAVHQFATPRDGDAAAPRQVESETQALASRLVGYIRDMGVDLAFFRRMSERPHEDLEYLRLAELERMNVVNHGRMSPEWRLGIDGSAVVLSGRQERIDNVASVTLRCGDPLVVDFSTDGFVEEWKSTVDSGGVRWLLGGASFAVDGGALARPVSIEGGRFRLGIRATAAQAALLPTSPSIGFEISAGGRRYEFEVDTGGGAAREEIARFVGYCNGSGRAELASVAGG